MEIVWISLLFLLGLVLIVKGGDYFVDASIWMAEVSGIPQFIIGATIVSLATTLPEMLVSFFSAAEGKVDMAIGNAVGSVTANTGLIMGIALIGMPILIERRHYLLRAALLMAAALIILLSGLNGAMGLVPNLVLLLIFALAMFDNVRQAKTALTLEATDTAAPKRRALVKKELWQNLLKFVLGAAAIVIGAELLVDNGSLLALKIGISERLISVTLVAIGTSLPEFVTTVTALRKKQGALSAGNIIGANIIDLTLILPICTLISGQALPISAQMASIDLPACLFVSLIAMVPMLITGRFHRRQGALLLLSYIVYLVITTALVG